MSAEETRNQIALSKELESINKRNFAALEKAAEIQKERSKILQDDLTLLEQEFTQREANLEKTRQALQDMQNSNLSLTEMTAALRENDELMKSIQFFADSTNQSFEDILKEIEEGGRGIEDLINKTQEFKAELEDSKKTIQELARTTQKFAGGMGMAAKFSETNLGKITEMGQKMFVMAKRGDGFAESLNKAVGTSFNLFNVLGTALDIIVKLTYQADVLGKNFQKK